MKAFKLELLGRVMKEMSSSDAKDEEIQQLFLEIVRHATEMKAVIESRLEEADNDRSKKSS